MLLCSITVTILTVNSAQNDETTMYILSVCVAAILALPDFVAMAVGRVLDFRYTTH